VGRVRRGGAKGIAHSAKRSADAFTTALRAAGSIQSPMFAFI